MSVDYHEIIFRHLPGGTKKITKHLRIAGHRPQIGIQDFQIRSTNHSIATLDDVVSAAEDI
jgi:hypothetical protein